MHPLLQGSLLPEVPEGLLHPHGSGERGEPRLGIGDLATELVLDLGRLPFRIPETVLGGLNLRGEDGEPVMLLEERLDVVLLLPQRLDLPLEGPHLFLEVRKAALPGPLFFQSPLQLGQGRLVLLPLRPRLKIGLVLHLAPHELPLQRGQLFLYVLEGLALRGDPLLEGRGLLSPVGQPRNLVAEGPGLPRRPLNAGKHPIETLLGGPGRPLEGFQPEELLKDLQALRRTRRPQLLHFLLTHEGGVTEAVVIQADDVLDEGLQLGDGAAEVLAVPPHGQVGRPGSVEAPSHVVSGAPLAEGHAGVSARLDDF